MTDKEKIKELIELIEDICQDVRERYGKDDVCGLCEYEDCVYVGAEGDYVGECPGFEKSDCFVLKEEFKKKFLCTNDSTG